MGLAKKLILKKDTIPSVYPVNVNMTRPLPITSATVSEPLRPVFRKK